MKICYFVCSIYFGGIEKIVVDSINELCKFYDVMLLVPKNCTYKNKVSDKVKIIEYQSYDKRYNIFLYLEIYKIIKNYDIVHTHGAKATQIAFLLNKISNFHHIATKHNTRKGKIFNKTKHTISVSKQVSNTINHKSQILYFGIKEENIKKDLDKDFTMVAIGRLDKIKGFDILIQEVAKLNFNFKLNIIGEGLEKNNLEKLITNNNLKNKVFLLGFKENISHYLASSHLQVITSLSEGLPISLLEGILYSNIILSTPVGGIIEVIDKDFLMQHDQIAEKITQIYNAYEKNYEDFQNKHNKFKQIFNFNTYILNLTKYYEMVVK